MLHITDVKDHGLWIMAYCHAILSASRYKVSKENEGSNMNMNRECEESWTSKYDIAQPEQEEDDAFVVPTSYL